LVVVKKEMLVGLVCRVRAVALSVALGGVCLLTATAASADYVVISSTAPAIAAGAVMADGDNLSLPADSLVTLLSQTGDTVTLRGPHNGPIAVKRESGGKKSMVAVVGRLLRSGDLEKTALGASRSVGDSAVPDGVKGIPAFVSGSYCGRPDGLELIRGDTKGVGRAAAVQTDTGREFSLTWPDGVGAIRWPSDLPPVDGGGYRLTQHGALQASEWVLHLLPPTVVDPTAQVAWMIERDCLQQAAALLIAVRHETVPFELYLTSDRGRQPEYRIGERMSLLAKSSHDAFLYCYVRPLNGPAVAIFPSTASGGARIVGSDLLHLPGKRMAVDLQAAAPPGIDRVHCFATEKAADDHLPEALRFRDFEPITSVGSEDFPGIFADLPTGRLAQATLSITVKQ